MNETFTLELIEVLKQNYLDNKLEIGEVNYSEPMEFGAICTIVDSEFENVILHFIHKHTDSGYPYEIVVEMRYLDSPVEWKISIDDYLISKLPEEMISEMESKMDELLEERFN
ncbi:hypothetical protein [Zunongwangia mangrovi]|nr:hypothetical protein [Zunongwangia mangrovi]